MVAWPTHGPTSDIPNSERGLIDGGHCAGYARRTNGLHRWQAAIMRRLGRVPFGGLPQQEGASVAQYNRSPYGASSSLRPDIGQFSGQHVGERPLRKVDE